MTKGKKRGLLSGDRSLGINVNKERLIISTVGVFLAGLFFLYLLRKGGANYAG